MKLSWRILGLLVVGLVCFTTVSRAQEMDDVDLEDMEDIIDEDELAEEEPEVIIPKERPVYKKPELKGPAHFSESFESEADFNKKWVLSKARKDEADDSIAKYDGVWSIEEATSSAVQGNLGLVLKSRAKHHAVSVKLDRTYEFSGKPFIVQYEVQFQNGQECGGAYIKLLTKDDKLNLAQFKDNTPYTIMFGPDKCGNDNKLHFIFRHKNPVTGQFEEKHAKKPSSSIDTFFTDKKTHLFTLVVNPDNTFEIFVDNSMVNSGSLLEDVEPAVNPPKEIVDPNDKKPADWDERERIPDPEAVKPEDWDETQPEMIPDEDAVKPDGWLDEEPELIPDADAEKPEDWDEDMDGEWEAPMKSNPECENAAGCGEWKRPTIKNPEYKGKWKAPMIDNPEYKGKWKPKKIANPDYFEDNDPYLMSPIDAIGLELWSMSDNILFNHFIVTDDKKVADQWAADTWEIIKAQEIAAAGGASVVDAVMDATRERPWLWAVFILVVVLPVILLIAYCCMSGSPKGASKSDKVIYVVQKDKKRVARKMNGKPDDIAQRKKTDEPTEDDDAEDEEEEEEEKTEKKSAKKVDATGDAKKKKSKSDLEEDAAQADVEEDAEEDKKEADAPSERRSPRRRKAKLPKE